MKKFLILALTLPVIHFAYAGQTPLCNPLQICSTGDSVEHIQKAIINNNGIINCSVDGMIAASDNKEVLLNIQNTISELTSINDQCASLITK